MRNERRLIGPAVAMLTLAAFTVAALQAPATAQQDATSISAVTQNQQRTPPTEQKPAASPPAPKAEMGPPAPGAAPAAPPVKPGAAVPQPTVQLKPGEMPGIKFDTPTYDFGRIPAGQEVLHDFWFTNTGNGPLEIISARPS